MQPLDVGFSLSEPALRAAPESVVRPPNFSPPKSCLYEGKATLLLPGM